MRAGCAAVVASLIALLVPAGAAAQQQLDLAVAARVKAAYLRHIAELTTWPHHVFARDGAPLVIGIVGDDAYGVGRLLESAIESKQLSAQQRPLAVVRLPAEPAGAESAAKAMLRRCHVLFVSHSGSDPWQRWRSAVEGLPIMTVGEMVGFSRANGMIEFVISSESGRVTMHVDLASVDRARLQLSSKLIALKVVHIVKRHDEARSRYAPVAVTLKPGPSLAEGNP